MPAPPRPLRSAPPPPCQAVGIIHWGRAWAIPLPGTGGGGRKRGKKKEKKKGEGARVWGEAAGGEQGSAPAQCRRGCVLGGLRGAGAEGLSSLGGAPYGNVSALLAVPLALSLTERRRRGGGGEKKRKDKGVEES